MSTQKASENSQVSTMTTPVQSGLLQKLAQIAKDSPVVVLLASAAAVATTAAGGVSWFHEQRNQFTQAKLERELVAPLREKVSDLEFRLRNIERSVGPQKQYLDVARLSIMPDEVTRLDARYKPVLAGNLFFAAPADVQGWSYSQASQRDLGTQLLGSDLLGELASANSDLADLINEKRGALWVGGASIEFELGEKALLRMMLDKGRLPLRLRPLVFAMPIDQQYLQKAGKAVGKIVEDMSKPTKALDEVLAKLSELLESNPKSPEMASSEKSVISTTTAKEGARVHSGSAVDLLSKLADTDLAGFCLMDALVSNSQTALLLGASSTVLAVEKKGNVFYLRIQMSTQHEGRRFILDQEVFFVGTAKGGVIIRTVIPSIDYQSPAYTWTQAFLAGLRVPLL